MEAVRAEGRLIATAVVFELNGSACQNQFVIFGFLYAAYRKIIQDCSASIDYAASLFWDFDEDPGQELYEIAMPAVFVYGYVDTFNLLAELLNIVVIPPS